MGGREEEPLGEPLEDPAGHHSTGPGLVRHERYHEGRDRADGHAADERPFRADLFGEHSCAYLENNVTPEERGEDRASVLPVVGLRESLPSWERFVIELTGMSGFELAEGSVMATIVTERFTLIP